MRLKPLIALNFTYDNKTNSIRVKNKEKYQTVREDDFAAAYTIKYSLESLNMLFCAFLWWKLSLLS